MELIFKVKIMLNTQEIREQFPILSQKVNDKPLVYLDNAASSQKPLTVIKKWEEYYQTINANVHRGIHTLSQLATWNHREYQPNLLLHHFTDKSRR